MKRKENLPQQNSFEEMIQQFLKDGEEKLRELDEEKKAKTQSNRAHLSKYKWLRYTMIFFTLCSLLLSCFSLLLRLNQAKLGLNQANFIRSILTLLSFNIALPSWIWGVSVVLSVVCMLISIKVYRSITRN